MLIFNISLFAVKSCKASGDKPVPTEKAPDQKSPVKPKEEPKVEPVRPKKEHVPEFVEVPVYRKGEEGTVYGDIISHVKGAPFGAAHGRSTDAHETSHGIHNELRNSYQQKLGRRVNGFYALEGRGVIIDEPGIKMSHAVAFIPENLRSYRYKLYMVQQLKDWNDTPLYILDEWTAYVNGGMCGVDDIAKGKHKEGWTDLVSGCLDFSIYTTALCMAVKKNDPEYWEKNPQLKNYVIWQMKRAEKTFLTGRVLKECKWETQDKLLLQLLTSTEAAPMRAFLKDELDGIWLSIDPAKVKEIDYEGTPK